MPICGTLRVDPGYTERHISVGENQCIIVPSYMATQPLYCQPGFCSGNPNAIATISRRDASGQEYTQGFSVTGGYLGEVCTKNCGAGSGVFGFGGEAGKILGAVAGIGSQVALQVGFNALAPGVGAALLSQASTYGQSGGKMGLNISGLLGGLGQAIGGINTSGLGNISQILGGGLQLAGAALQPQTVAATPQYASYSPMVTGLASSSQVIRSAAPAVAGGITSLAVGTAALQAAKALLPKVAAALGRKGITLSKAVDVARKLGKFFSSPEAIGLYMGLTVAELAQLITAQAARKRRRMNPANSHALRRAARRIKSFHRLCQHTDLIKTRHRSSYRSAGRCTTCRKSPCRC